jgi:hypothetical protein
MMVLLPCRKKAAEAQKQLQQSSEAEQQLEGQVRGPYSPPAQQRAHRLCFPPPPPCFTLLVQSLLNGSVCASFQNPCVHSPANDTLDS